MLGLGHGSTGARADAGRGADGAGVRAGSGRGEESGAGGGRRSRGGRRSVGQRGSSVGPDQGSVLDTFLHLGLGDDVAVERVQDDSGAGDIAVNNLGGYGRVTLHLLVVVLVVCMVVVARDGGSEANGCRKKGD